MKKIFVCLMASALCASSFISCDTQTDVEAGGTAVQSMAGDWEVTIDLADEDGVVLMEDPYGLGASELYTYNTAANKSTEMWIDDLGNFWAYKFVVETDINKMTFQTSDYVPYDDAETGNAKIVFGKVLKNAGKNLHGAPNDSIAFLIQFDDDADPSYYYLIHGQRVDGFYE